LIKVKKYIIIIILFANLTVPVFFGLYLEYFTIRELNWVVIIITISGLFILLFMGKIIEIFGYNQKNVEVMRENDVINALINGDSKLILWFFFPIIIITEELIFRYYTIGFLDYNLKLEPVIVIILSSLFFSTYHIHIWFRYKNLTILLINLGYPFMLGLYNGYVFLNIGIIPCILAHYFIAFYSYYNIYRRYFHN
jgi:hypothetical protein